MGSKSLMQRGLIAAGGSTAVTAAGWFGERNVSRVSSRIAEQSIKRLVPRIALSRNARAVMQQNIRAFTTASAKAKESVPKVASPPPSSSFFVFRWYEGHLEKSPVLTKMATGAILWGLGDGVAQMVPHFAFESSSEEENSTAAFTYDWPRTGRAVAFGGLIHAPTSHVHFNLLEWMTNRAGVTGLAIPVFKTVMEQFVYWSWISNSMYHGAMGAMQGMTLQQIYDRIEDVLWETQKAQWVFWIPVQLLNFKFVPVRHQLNVVLVTSIVWTALLSMWYPPVQEAPTQAAKV